MKTLLPQNAIQSSLCFILFHYKREYAQRRDVEKHYSQYRRKHGLIIGQVENTVCGVMVDENVGI